MNQESANPLDNLQLISINEMIDSVAGRQLKDFGKVNTEIKPDGTLITNCDRWSDQFIINGISEITNNQEGILSEEGSKILPTTNAFWVVDPLDGTTNFAAGIPHWGISIARFRDGEPETAFLDIPVLKKRILAIRGKGVWINGQSIKSKKKFALSKSVRISL